MFIPYKKNKGYKVPVIFEFGQQNIRVGYAGADGPQAILPSDFLMDSEGNMKFIEQNSTFQPIGYDIKNLLQGGQIVDFDVWKEYVEHIINNILKQENNFPFFFIENGIVKKEIRNKMIEMLFEDIEVSSVFFHRNTMLAQYIVGRDNVLVVDCGANHTTVTPILDGNVIEKATITGNVGGEFITNKLFETWKKQRLQFSRYTNYNQLTPSLQLYGDFEVIREIKHQSLKFYDQPIENLKFNPTVDNQVYELPDQSRLLISEEMYKFPEYLFEPSEGFEGLDRALELSLEKIDSDYRKELVQNIILIGGTSSTVNIVERLQRTINNLKILGLSSRSKVQTLPKCFDRQHASWIGGSIVASSQIYEQWTLNKSDYEEHGASLIEKKMFY